MRAVVLGAAISDRELLRQFVRASSRITHTDPRAEQGAFAVALAAHAASRQEQMDPVQFATELRAVLDGEVSQDLLSLVDQAVKSWESGASTPEFAAARGWQRGVSGFVNHTVPVVLHAWFRHPTDYAAAVTEVIQCGGDADTTAAIVGGITGAAVGADGIPRDWLAGIWEWPRTVTWMRRLATEACGEQAAGPVPRLPALGLLPRNAFFAAVVLAHGFRRALPPY